MKTIQWNSEKEKQLLSNTTRGSIGFADCVVAIDDGRILDVLPHPTRKNQKVLVLNIEDYAYAVPFVEDENGNWFLKTVFPSRKYTAIYLSKRKP